MGSRSWKRRNHKNLISHVEDRFCPPIEVLLAGGENVEKHLSICNKCQRRLEEASDWNLPVTSYNWQNIVNDPKKDVDIIKLGEVRRIHSQGKNWNAKGLYHNEPLVLILSSDEEWTRVSLLNVHGNFLFGDEEEKIEIPNLTAWAEIWNIFGVSTSLVGTRVLGRVSESQVQKILLRNEKEFRSWERNSPQSRFHRIEATFGCFYSLRNFYGRNLRSVDEPGILESKLALQGQVLE